jgi:hypothetical protein
MLFGLIICLATFLPIIQQKPDHVHIKRGHIHFPKLTCQVSCWI